MSGINKAFEVGRLTRDAELKYASSGTAICNFSIAVSEYMGQGKEEWTNYFDCVMFGKRAEGINQYLNKGQQVVIDGLLHQERWESENGMRSKVVIKVQNIELVGAKREGTKETKRTEGGSDPKNFKDDIPF